MNFLFKTHFYHIKNKKISFKQKIQFFLFLQKLKNITTLG